MSSTLIKFIGYKITLLFGDTLVLDRWRWLRKRLPFATSGETLLDAGCGTGAFTLGAAKKGYNAMGLSWDDNKITKANHRASICKLKNASFEQQDLRELDSRKDLYNRFDVVLSFENIEHVWNDKKLLMDLSLCLKPGGRLLLTTPYYFYNPISSHDRGPFENIEDGRHVRRGYTPAMLQELCNLSGLTPSNITFCSGFLSQKITSLFRLLSGINLIFAWLVILPLRILPPIFDRLISKITHWNYYSICMEAYKPRYEPKT